MGGRSPPRESLGTARSRRRPVHPVRPPRDPRTDPRAVPAGHVHSEFWWGRASRPCHHQCTRTQGTVTMETATLSLFLSISAAPLDRSRDGPRRKDLQRSASPGARLWEAGRAGFHGGRARRTVTRCLLSPAGPWAQGHSYLCRALGARCWHRTPVCLTQSSEIEP